MDRAAAYDEILMMLFAQGAESIGLAPIERWRSLLARARRQGRFLGVDEDDYPADFATFARYHQALPELPDPHPLSWSELEDFITRDGSRLAVRWLPGDNGRPCREACLGGSSASLGATPELENRRL